MWNVLQVELIAAPSTIVEAWNEMSYPHITLAVGPGANAVDSNELPKRIADAADMARRVQLPQPIPVIGQLLAFV